MSKHRKWGRRLAIAAIALLLIGAATTLIVLSVMFPSRDSLVWPVVPEAGHLYADRSEQVAVRLIDALDRVEFAADPSAGLAALGRYKYVLESPYLPTDRVAARRVFSVAVGDVLLDAALSRVAHASSVYEGRYAVYLPAGDAMSFSAGFAPGAILRFGLVGIPDHADTVTCPVDVEVVQHTPQHVDIVALGRFGLGPEDFTWKDFAIALRPDAVRVELKAKPVAGCNEPGHAFVAEPTVWVPRDGPAPINVLYVNVCTFRADDLGAGNRGATPALDALSATAHAFTHARANANWSKASQISALTGRYPSSLGLKHYRVPVSDFERRTFEGSRWPTLASTLRDRGYETLALVDNIFLAGYLRVGVDLGFARFVDNARDIRNTIDLVGDAIAWLEDNGDKPFLLYLNLAAPHARYRPPREYLWQIGFGWSDLVGDLERALHLGEVAYTDDAIGALLKTVENLGLSGRTLIVIHGDHGETMEPAEDLEVEVPSADQPRESMIYPTTLYKHGWSWQEPELRVPLMFARAGTIAAAQDPRPVSPIDVTPTILAQLGEPKPASMAGRDLFASPPTAPILVEGKQFDAVFDGDLKYVRFWPGYGWWRRKSTGVVSTAPELLFDLAADPGEEVNLAAQRPADVARLSAALDRVKPRPEPLHFMRLQGPAGQRVVGEVRLPGGVASAVLTGQAPGERVVSDGEGLRFSVTLGDAPVTLSFSARGPGEPALTVSGVDHVLVGPYALPLLVPGADGAYHGRTDLLALGADQWPAITPAPAAVQLLWWSHRRTECGPEPWRLESLEADVMDAMRSWGYAK